MRNIHALACLTLALLAARAFAADDAAGGHRGHFDVRDYGAVGDGKALDTAAINQAIHAASAAGGGTVYFGAGTYASFSVHLESNVSLFLDRGAILLAAGPTTAGLRSPQASGGTKPPANGALVPGGLELIGAKVPPKESPAGGAPAYDAPEPNPEGGAFQDFGHTHFQNSFIWGENLHDISILGPGMIDGNGLPNSSGPGDRGVGNKALALKLCRNVTLRDVTFYRGGWFCILATGVDNFTIDGCKFDSIRDGMDIDSCKNVHISNCDVNTPNDDGICLKSDYALGQPRACENVTITNCMVSGFRCGTLLDGTYDRSTGNPYGRIKFGTESNGGFKNIAISNCVFDHSRGLAIESVDGAIVEDVTVDNLAMRDVKNAPIFIRLGNRARGPEGKTPVGEMRRINISNVTASGISTDGPCQISGIPDHPIEDLRLSNIRLAFNGGGAMPQNAASPAEKEKDYPDVGMFGALPCSAFFLRHVKGLEMHHVDVTFARADARPPLALFDVDGADFQHMNVQRFPDVPLFTLNGVAGFSTQFVRGIQDMKLEKADKQAISQ